MTFKLKLVYSLKNVISETLKLLRSTEKNITKIKNGENISKLEVTEVILVYWILVNNGFLNIQLCIPMLKTNQLGSD